MNSLEGGRNFAIRHFDQGPEQPTLERQFYVKYIGADEEEGECKNLKGVPKGARILVNIKDGTVLRESSAPDESGYYWREIVKTESNVYIDHGDNEVPFERQVFRK